MIISLYNLIIPKQLYYLDLRFIIALNMTLEVMNSATDLSGGLKQKASSSPKNRLQNRNKHELSKNF
jgi:hypothetical protein